MTGMRRNALICLLTVTMYAGCEVTGPFTAEESFAEEAQVNLRIEMQYCPPSTRARLGSSFQAPDEAISGGVILEFDQDGELLETIAFTGNVLPVLPVRRYQQTDIYIVANPTVDLSLIKSKEEFLSKQSEYSSNTSGKLEMTGHVRGIFDSDATVSVAMERMVSKITLDALVFKLATTKYNYTGAHLQQAFMEKTPATCGYGLSLTGNFLNAYERRIGIGYFTSYPSVNKYTQGEYKVWEYDYPQSVYCYPNNSETAADRNKFAVNYRLVYQIDGVDGLTGEPIVISRYDDNCVHLVLPKLRPNTEYELERLTITGAKNKTVYLGTRSGQEDLYGTCCFRMTDMTSGEYLGNAEGEVEYEMQDS